MKRRSPRRNVSLPWERRGAVVQTWIGRARLRVVPIGALVAFGGWLVVRHAEETARRRTTRLAIQEVRAAAARFVLDVGRCPTTQAELVRPPVGHGPYLDRLPRDGWGRALFFGCPARFDPDDFDVVSAGPTASFFDVDGM